MELTSLEGATKPTTTISTSTDVVVDDHGWSVSGIEHSALVRTVYGVIGFSGMAGNALVCFVLIRVPPLRTRTSRFVVNLAIADFLTSFWLIPIHVFPQVPSIPKGLAGEFMCRFYISKYILWLFIITSIYFLVVVTLERYVAVVHPLKYKRVFTTRLTVLISSCCLLIGIMAPTFFFFVYDVVDSVCIYLPYPSPAHKLGVGLLCFTVIYGIPIVILLLLHSQTIKSLRRQAKTLAANIAEHGQSEQPRRNVNISGEIEGNRRPTVVDNDNNKWHLKVANDMQKTFFVVILVFILCWAPNQLLFLCYSLGAPVDFSKTYYHFSVIFAVCNSCANPFIYVFKNKLFRRGIRQAVRCVGRGDHDDRSASVSFRQFENSVQPHSTTLHQQNQSRHTTVSVGSMSIAPVNNCSAINSAHK
ncbi:galanin receptor 2a-like [Lytechinus variegatus]|uniref:galanin receptor 2a-like n=1 Tax=Lytechinus variegatus TaxID=7654 RepID=UPI001BB2820D|nr:galanin receptor 2a-like [Lytechinus variegatus]